MIVTVTGERDWLNKQQVWDELDEMLTEHVVGWIAKQFHDRHDEFDRMSTAERDAAAAKTFILRHGVSGNVDFAANDWGKERGVTIERFHAEWRPGGQYDPAAGPIRNRKMAQAKPRADLGLAFWSGKMRMKGGREYSGSLSCIKELLLCGIEVRVIPPKELP